MTDKQDLIREIQEYVAAHGGENTATHLLVQAAAAISEQAAELEAVGAGGVQPLSPQNPMGTSAEQALAAINSGAKAVPHTKLTEEIDNVLSDPDSSLSPGAVRTLQWCRTWVDGPLFIAAPQPEAAPQAAPRIPDAWTNLLAYVLQDDMHNRLTPRVVDIAYTAFMQAKRPNDEDGGASDWFNDTKPNVMRLIEKLRKDLTDDFGKAAPQAAPAQEPEGISRDDTVHGETYFTAADMATAAAQGFRDGVTSLSLPAAGQEPVAEVMFADGCKYIQYTMPLDLIPVGTRFYAAPQPAVAARSEQIAEAALLKVLAAVQRYLPPDGPNANDTLSEIIEIVDPWPLGPLEKS